MKRSTLVWSVIFVLAAAWLAWRAVGVRAGTLYVQEVDGTEIPAGAWDRMTGLARPSPARTLGLWVGAFFTLAVFSFMYRDNPFYKLAESVMVGVSAAYWMVVGFWTTIIPNLLGKLFPAWINSWAVPGLSPVRESNWYLYFVPLIMSGMLLWRLSPKGSWLARWPLAFIIGTTAGIRLVGFIQADFLSQISNSIKPLIAFQNDLANGARAFDLGATLTNLLLVACVLCCLVYFFFSFEHRGLAGKFSRVGIWCLMITFGAAFGFTVMGRIALLAGRLEFLFDDWLWLIDPRGLRPPDWSGFW